MRSSRCAMSKLPWLASRRKSRTSAGSELGEAERATRARMLGSRARLRS
jgi:hypothetical protein